MRIGFVTERMRVGFGVDLVVDQVASRLAERGHEVVVYAAQIDDPSAARPYGLEHLPVVASHAYPVYERRARRWASYLDARKHDVLFIETFPFFSLIPLLSTPVIAVDHGISPSEGLSAPRRAMFRYIRETQYDRYIARAAAIACVSDFLRNELPPSLRARARVIHNGADHYPSARERRAKTRESLGLAQDDVVVLYVGRLNHERQPYKGTADLLRLAARWRAAGIRLVMAGRGTPEDGNRIAAAGAVPVLEPPVDRLAGLYAAADMYATASRWEGFDLPAAEAAYAGLPVTALDAGAHPEVIEHGVTGILASDVESLATAVERLAADPGGRDVMGSRARDRALQRFRWEDAVTSYEEMADTVARPRAAEGGSGADVTAVVLNYGAEDSVLESCIASLESQTVPVDVILVDNGSPKNREVPDAVVTRHPQVRLIRLPRNLGFSGGMNRGIEQVRTPYVLILNNDTDLRPDAVEQMRRVLAGDETLAGVAPKIVFNSDPDVIDAVGNLILESGAAFNMGIGQIDIGQYDRVERTFGACFAATLIRTEMFDPGFVGPLDETYFMYYEDIDWCFRANVFGYGFATAPAAIVRHHHSYSVRDVNYSFKYRLIERNLLRTVVKNFARSGAIVATLRRLAGHGVGILRGQYRKERVLVCLETIVALPRLLRTRARIQGRRRSLDRAIFAYARGERAAFDPQRYAPERRISTLQQMYRRKYLVTGDVKYREILTVAEELMQHRLGSSLEVARDRLAPLLKDEPSVVQQLAEELEG